MSATGPGAEPDQRSTSVRPAARLSRSRWRDPGLAVGVLLVAGSVALGARVLAGADDTVAVWSVRSDTSAGSVLDDEQLEVVDVRLPSDDPYLSADTPAPAGAVLLRDVAAGELLAPSQLLDDRQPAGAQLPLSVAVGAMPVDLAVAEVVDVWVAAPGSAAQVEPAVRVLEAVPVVSVQRAGGQLGDGGEAVVLVAVAEDDGDALPETLGRLADGVTTLVRVG